MGAESLTDEEIQRLQTMRKTVTWASKEFVQRNQGLLADFELEGDDGTKFAVYARQNLRIKEDFSCGLRVKLQSGEEVTLCRYNGPSHVHPNPLENQTLKFVCHVHEATERYIAIGKKPEHFARESSAYDSLTSAASCLAKDCNIAGLVLPNLQQGLFK